MRWLVVLGFVLGSFGPGTTATLANDGDHCQADEVPRFALGFADLQASLGEIMGTAITCAYPDPHATGDVQQATSTGLAFWRKSTNTATFTNGWQHWALTEAGVVTWAGTSLDPSPSAVPIDVAEQEPGPTITPSGLTPIVRTLLRQQPDQAGADLSAAPQGRYTGTPADVAVQATGLGPGWAMAWQQQAPADGATTGPLTTFFEDGDRLASSTTFVYRTRAQALAAWHAIPGGSLEICEASVYGGLGDGTVDGACLIQNVAIELDGAPFGVVQTALERVAQRIQTRLAPRSAPAEPGPLYRGAPTEVRVQLAELGPGWNLAREEQQRANEYSSGLLRTDYREGSGPPGAGIGVDVEVFYTLENARAGFSQRTQYGGEPLALCDEGWVNPGGAFAPRSVLCRQANVVLRVSAPTEQQARRVIEPMRQRVVGGLTECPRAVPPLN